MLAAMLTIIGIACVTMMTLRIVQAGWPDTPRVRIALSLAGIVAGACFIAWMVLQASSGVGAMGG